MIHKWGYTNYHDLNLDWILEKIQSLELTVKKIEDLSNEWAETLEDIKNDIETMERLYNDIVIDNEVFKRQMDSKFNDLSSNINQEFNTLKYSIDTTMKQYMRDINLTISSFNSQLVAMDRKLNEALANLWMELKMVNPFTGQEESVLNVIDYLASLHMQDGITAQDYDALELTAQTYDDKELTAREYDTQADILLRN